MAFLIYIFVKAQFEAEVLEICTNLVHYAVWL